jgi:hypothetical protein
MTRQTVSQVQHEQWGWRPCPTCDDRPQRRLRRPRLPNGIAAASQRLGSGEYRFAVFSGNGHLRLLRLERLDDRSSVMDSIFRAESAVFDGKIVSGTTSVTQTPSNYLKAFEGGSHRCNEVVDRRHGVTPSGRGYSRE